MGPIKIVAFAGSLRSGSLNKKLIRIAAAGARAAGAQVTDLDLRDVPMPLYDGDIEREHGLPPNAKVFKRLLVENHGMLISSPEYNSAFPAVLGGPSALERFIVVVVVARWRGFASLIGLGFAGFILVAFMFPALIAGTNPIMVGLIGSAAIMFVALYAAHGFSARTTPVANRRDRGPDWQNG